MNYSTPFVEIKNLSGKLFVWNSNKNRKILILLIGQKCDSYNENKICILKLNKVYDDWNLELGTRNKYAHFGSATYVLC